MSDVIYFTSDEVGAPALSQTAGDLISVLDACLVNGFNAKSVLALSVSGGVATAQISAHGYLKGRKLLIGGSSIGALNGVKKILSLPDANHVTFDATGVADGSATGTITSKRAPLGWTKQFGDSTHGMYKRVDPTATSQLVRVDDSAGGHFARMISVESATDINTFVGQAPSISQITDGLGYCVSRGGVAAARWAVVGDGVVMYLFVDHFSGISATNGMVPHGWGDLIPFRASDAYHTFIGGGIDGNLDVYFLGGASQFGLGTNTSVLQRSFTQFGAPVGSQTLSRCFGAIGGSSNPAYPSPVDAGMIVAERLMMTEDFPAANNPIRGYFRGLREPLANVPYSMSQSVLTNVGETDRDHVVMSFLNRGTGDRGTVLIDVDGPWA